MCILTNGFSHHYQLDEPTFIFRVVRYDFYLFIFSHFSMKCLCANRIAHIWGHSFGLCPIKGMPGLNELTCDLSVTYLVCMLAARTHGLSPKNVSMARILFVRVGA